MRSDDFFTLQQYISFVKEEKDMVSEEQPYPGSRTPSTWIGLPSSVLVPITK